MRISLSALVVLCLFHLPSTFAIAQETAEKTATFSGVWRTSFGDLQLSQTGDSVEGKYPLGTVSGKVAGNRLTLKYVEQGVNGEAIFVLAEDGKSFSGKWRPQGATSWGDWNGIYRSSPPKPQTGFAGLWETSYGRMRLSQNGDDVSGAYESGAGGSNISGELKEKRFIFRYKEPEVEGSGWFELAPDGQSFNGKWRPDGASDWHPWVGKRVQPIKGRLWLIVLEAHWERGLSEPEYAFGDMLRSYFTMAASRHVAVRHRFFHDESDFRRFTSEVRYLAEPVVLLISTHGTPKGIQVGGKTLTSDMIASALAGVGNLHLLHLSGCAMMAGDVPREIHKKLGKGATFPISGYKTNVAWDASALGDFTFLSMLLIRRMDPELAARQAILNSPYLGDKTPQGAAFAPLGLSVLRPPSP